VDKKALFPRLFSLSAPGTLFPLNISRRLADHIVSKPCFPRLDKPESVVSAKETKFALGFVGKDVS
jgi:hypothetical protein